ncbi:unnamed protein product [Prorocentrum cordatum]|uniref:Uncharacterized protein n=1 Tax=Prorocentrum cordatum TaxID=2364126 RepID=A0ABN9XE85_9DINO|nr:unnamed protein product [Polarella glacialis]
MGKGKHVMKCCVQDIYSLTRLKVPVPFAFGQDLDTMFMLLKWLAVLSISWTLKDLPIVPSSAQSSGFLNGCWLDLMDAVVFDAYLVNDRVLYPKYGIDSDGTAAEKDEDYMNLLRLTWIVVFVLATLSPALYTSYSHSGEEDDGAGTENAPRDFAHSAESLIRSLQMLERQSALDHVEECLAIQREAYAQHSVEAGEAVLVKVAPEGHEKLVTADKLLQDLFLAAGGRAPRPGQATMLHGGTYSVQFTDMSDSNSDDEIVPVSRVYPDASAEAEKRMCRPGCCSGWCGVAGLNGKFQRKATLIDSVRSLFFLEVPFFLWRLYFEWDGLTFGSFVVILMLKNFVWAIMDFLTILSCGDNAATCLGMMPVSMLSEALEGSALSSVSVGPAGLFSLAAATARKQVAISIKEQRSKLKVRNAWLIIERQKAEDGHDVEAIAVLTEEINRVEGQLKVLDEQEKMNHG